MLKRSNEVRAVPVRALLGVALMPNPSQISCAEDPIYDFDGLRAVPISALARTASAPGLLQVLAPPVCPPSLQ